MCCAAAAAGFADCIIDGEVAALVDQHRLRVQLLQPDFRGDPGFAAAPALYPEDWLFDRLLPLCRALEGIRGACGGRAVRVLSGYRPPAYDAARRAAGHTGVAEHSQHGEGRAADIQIGGVEPRQIYEAAQALYLRSQIRIGGLGLYRDFVHVDVRPGKRLVTWEG